MLYHKDQIASRRDSYMEKLRDPRWQKRRLEILSRDEFRCRICGAEQATLNVHHIEYTAAEPWDEPPENLVTLCEHCHSILQHCKTREQRTSFNAILIAANEYRHTFVLGESRGA